MNLLEQPLVTVVTPVYNGEKYLVECIESVLAQTYQKLEYIIVNNCSTDRSPEIIKAYAEKDSRIHLYNNNELISAAENHQTGFRQMSPKSKYCKVVHADDWLFPECIEKMVNLAEDNSSVGIIGSYRLDGIWVNLDGLPYPSHVSSGRDICRAFLLGGPYVFGSPTSLLIRSDIVRNRDPLYDESRFPFFSDTAVCYEILQEWDFGFVHQVLTFTRRHNETQTTRAGRLDIVNHLILLKEYGRLYLSQGEYERCFQNRLQSYYSYLGNKLFKTRDKTFWNYQRRMFERIGCQLEWKEVVKAALQEKLDIILFPARKMLKKAFQAKRD
jgi:glycosyltransferase involved in cell wall biosynthesis